MDICAICGKPQEGIIIELEEDDGQIREKHVCNSCWEVIASIAVKAVKSELKPLVDELEPLVEFLSEFKEMYNESRRFRGKAIKETTSGVDSVDDLLSHAEELLDDMDSLDSDEDLHDSDFSNDEKTIAGISNDVLANQLLSFAKELDINQDEADSLSRDVVDLFWKSKGIRNEFSASAKTRIKMKQVGKMARTKIVESIFSATNDELARELADYAKEKEGKENGQGIYIQTATSSFWRSKGLDYGMVSPTTEQRRAQIERLAQELIDKDFHEWRDKRLQMESQNLPRLTQVCVEWALSTGRNKVTTKDIKYFRQEKKIEMLEATERALYLSTNNELKTKRQSF